MTEPDSEEGRTSWRQQTITISQWKLLGLVLAAGSMLAFIGLALAAIPTALLGFNELQTVLACFVILTAISMARLVFDLHRLVRARARRRRLSARDDEDEEGA